MSSAFVISYFIIGIGFYAYLGMKDKESRFVFLGMLFSPDFLSPLGFLPGLFAASIFVFLWPVACGIYIVGKPIEPSEVEKTTLHEINLNAIVGREGIAKTRLMPVGKISIDGDYYEAISQRGAICAGDRILVDSIEMGRARVTKIEQVAAGNDR